MMCTGSPTVYYNCVLPILFSNFILGKWSKSQGGKCSKSENQTCCCDKKRKIDGIAQLQKFKCNNCNFHSVFTYGKVPIFATQYHEY